MKRTERKRKKHEFYYEALKALGGSPMLERFKTEVLPNITVLPGWGEEMSEEEYQKGLAIMRLELPYYARFVLDCQP
jgi:hypothetical protein